MALPRLVADTNVYAYLESGHGITPSDVDVLVTAASRCVSPFWASELSMHEIAFQASTGSVGYQRAQRQFRWMERLCGDRMAPPVHVVLWNAAREPLIQVVPGRNEAWLAERRAIVTLPEARFRPVAALDHPRKLMEQEKRDWVDALVQLRPKIAKAARDGEDIDAATLDGLLAGWKKAPHADYPSAFTLRRDQEILHALRESWARRAS